MRASRNLIVDRWTLRHGLKSFKLIKCLAFVSSQVLVLPTLYFCDEIMRETSVKVLILLTSLLVCLSRGYVPETRWGEKAPPGCTPCPKGEEGLFDTPICGMNGIAYKTFCYLNLRNCIAKKLKKIEVLPSRSPKTCGLQTKMFNSFPGTAFRRKRRAVEWILREQARIK